MEYGTAESVNLMTLAVVIVSCLLMSDLPASGVPPTREGPKPTSQHSSPKDTATHATKGVIKTVSATALVVTRRTSGKRTDTTFVLTPSTHTEGALAAGSTVEIRYRTDGGQKIATAVSVEAAPQ
jgi:hypothetical protein